MTTVEGRTYTLECDDILLVEQGVVVRKRLTLGMGDDRVSHEWYAFIPWSNVKEVRQLRNAEGEIL